MDGKNACKALPDHLVERIIAMIPFPAIFQARCLSKSWRARFSSIASQDDEAMKCTASYFQNLVRERSKNWETFCPVFIGTNGDLIAYDKKTHNWRNLPSLSFLPKAVRWNSYMQIDGALLHSSDFKRSEDMYVANILTRTWKHLPFPPTIGRRNYTSKLVVTERSLGTYKVVLFCLRDLYETDFPLFQIYDSKLDSWRCIKLDFKRSHDPRSFSMIFFRILDRTIPTRTTVFFGDILYVSTNCQKLFAFDVRQGTFKELELQLSNTIYAGWEGCHSLVVCEEELLMVLYRDNTSAIVLKIDLDSLTLTAWNSGAPFLASLELSTALAPVGDKDHIFFGYVGDRGSRMRAYNVKKHQWSASFAPPTPSADCKYNWIASFQPGFGPFAAV